MSDLLLEEAQKDFCEILGIHIQTTWSQHLTEGQQDEVLEAAAELAAVYLNVVPIERRWCIAYPDKLAMRFRELIESVIQDAFSRVNAFVIADNIADFSADIFNQIKLIIDDGSDDDSGSDMEMAMDITNDTPAAAFSGLEEENENIHAVDFQGSNEMGESSTTSQAMEVEAMQVDGQDDEHEEADDEQQAQGAAMKKGKNPRQSRGPKIDIDPNNNPLYSMVMAEDKDKSKGLTKHYKCKLAGCGFQGAWNARKVHFETRHEEEWKDATGLEPTVYKCSACEYTTKRSTYIGRHEKKEHPELVATKAKKGKKAKK